jgi:hypothetical protein
MRNGRLLSSPFVLVNIFLAILAASTVARAAPQATPGEGTLLVGAASHTVLPLVNGSYAYLKAGFPARKDAFDPGIPVPKWDAGRIAVGNGESDSYWVHDDIRATAMAIDDPRSTDIVVIVATDLYMVFRNDAEQIRAKAAALLPAGQARKLKIVVSATHNHHGPDTAFDVNHTWYAQMVDQVAATVAAAVKNRRPARMQVAAGEHWFGMNDGTDPQIFDPRLNVLQAIDTQGKVIATAVQWNNHPEGTLGWEPPLDEIADDCVQLGLTGSNCNAEGRYFTSDFPGIVRDDLHARYGGEVLFLNGALGVLIGPGGAQVWEVDQAHPLGNQMIAPAGAVGPAGTSDYKVKNFRRTEMIGEQLALAAMRLLDNDAEKLTAPRVSYQVQPFYTYLSNFGFRILLVVDPATGRSSLGHANAPLYNCPLTGPKTAATCEPDEFKSDTDPIGVEYRVGDHLRSAVEYVRIGPVGMMFLPGEIPGELTVGLPAEFRSTPQNWYEEPVGRHAFGDDYTIPGYAARRMTDSYEWMVGLGSDQIGYFVPLSNYRVACIADMFAGSGTCAALHAGGLIEFPDAIAGATCKRITEDPGQLAPPFPQDIAQAIAGSCRYGQALGEAQGHYEETNSAGWDIAQDMLDAVGELTGSWDATEVNPVFPGWWEGYLPPGNLP